MKDMISFVNIQSNHNFHLSSFKREVLFLSYNAKSGALHERSDVSYLFAVGHLFFYLLYSIEKGSVAEINPTVGVGNVLAHLLVNAIASAHGEVYSTIFRALRADDIRRNVL